MVEVVIDTASRTYTARIGRDTVTHVAELVRSATAVVVVFDDNVAHLHGERIGRVFADVPGPVHHWVVPAGEDSKSWWQAEALLDFLCSHEIDRSAVLVAVGGGVVGDLTGFVASVWLRGVDFINCPTTLLAAIDASVGGKTGLNHGARKNLVGTIHQPAAVLIDTVLLATVPQRQWCAALAESIKQALLDGDAALGWHEQHLSAVLDRDEQTVADLLAFNVRFKGSVVARDETDRTGLRAQLNFGHTVGHGIEAACGYQLSHGECVAIGMVAAMDVGLATGRSLGPLRARLVALLQQCELPTALPEDSDVQRIMLAMRADKKSVEGGLRFVLPQDAGTFDSGVPVDWDVVERVLCGLQ